VVPVSLPRGKGQHLLRGLRVQSPGPRGYCQGQEVTPGRCGAGCCGRLLSAPTKAQGAWQWVLYRGWMLQLSKPEPGKIAIFPKPGNIEIFPFQSLFLRIVLSQSTEPHACWICGQCLWWYLRRSSGRISVPSQRLCCPACGCRPPCPAPWGSGSSPVQWKPSPRRLVHMR